MAVNHDWRANRTAWRATPRAACGPHFVDSRRVFTPALDIDVALDYGSGASSLVHGFGARRGGRVWLDKASSSPFWLALR